MGEGSLDAVALAIERVIEAALHFSQGAGRDDGGDATLGQVVQDGVGVVALVGEHGFRFARAEQRDGLGAIMRLAAGQNESEWQPEFIREQVNLGRQTSSTPPQSGLLTPFFRAVAACWWARTTLESIMT